MQHVVFEGRKEDTVLHSLPCKIEYDGGAPVQQFFIPTQITQGLFQSAFRGRKLTATSMQVPEKTCGVILEQKGNSWRSCGIFREMYLWEPDEASGSRLKVQRDLQEMMKAMESLHAPVSLEDLSEL